METPHAGRNVLTLDPEQAAEELAARHSNGKPRGQKASREEIRRLERRLQDRKLRERELTDELREAADYLEKLSDAWEGTDTREAVRLLNFVRAVASKAARCLQKEDV